MPVQTRVSRDMEKFEDLERRLRGYDGFSVSYYRLQEITKEYREYLRLAVKYTKSVRRIIKIHKIYGNLLERMERQNELGIKRQG